MPSISPEDLRYLLQRKRRIEQNVSTGLVPSDVGGILSEADIGFSRRQSRLCTEIIEKDWDLAQALATRRAAISSVEWSITSDEAGGEAASAQVHQILSSITGDTAHRLIGLEEWMTSCVDALLPGFSVSEVYWRGDGTIQGFRPFPAWYFTHYMSIEPRLVIQTSEAETETMALDPAERFVIIDRAAVASDPARGGLIRPIGWVYAFRNLIWKFLLRYAEKFGLPYVAANIQTDDQKVFEAEAEKVKDAIQNMGSDGGALFSGLTELNFVEPQYADGEVFFRTLSDLRKAVDKLILGQTSTSDSESSNRSTAQVHDLIRRDLLKSDCRTVARAVNQQIIPIICAYRSISPVPQMVFDLPSHEETLQLLEMVETAHKAGLELENVEQINRRSGLRFSKKRSTPAPTDVLPPDPEEDIDNEA